MAKTQKAKTSKGTRNDARKNGKASKAAPGKTRTYAKLTELELFLMGKGVLATRKPVYVPTPKRGSDD